MSYILDSLKKSEQQRRQGELPNLQSDHPGSSPPPRRKRLLWPWLVVLALLLNAGLLAWWRTSAPSAPQTSAVPAVPGPSQPRATQPLHPAPAAAVAEPAVNPPSVPQSTPPPIPQATPQPDPTKAAGPGAPVVNQPPLTPPQPVVSTPKPAPSATATPHQPPAPTGPATVVPLEELPAAVRSGLPDLTLSLLYYTASPEKRMARLNGHNLREGDEVQSGVVLKEIRPEGAVISFRGQLILLPRP